MRDLPCLVTETVYIRRKFKFLNKILKLSTDFPEKNTFAARRLIAHDQGRVFGLEFHRIQSFTRMTGPTTFLPLRHKLEFGHRKARATRCYLLSVMKERLEQFSTTQRSSNDSGELNLARQCWARLEIEAATSTDFQRRRFTMRYKQFTLSALLLIFIGQGRAQSFQRRSCGILSPPKNGMISSCNRGSRSGSVCVVRCAPGFGIDSSRRTCTCIGGLCVWEGDNPVCEVSQCPTPNYENGKIIIVERWPKGFAGLVEFADLPVAFQHGWSLIIAFNKALGHDARMSSWSAEPAGMSNTRNAFTLNNAPHNQNPTNNVTLLRTLFVVDNVDEEAMPKKGYVGLYDRRIGDATCFPTAKYVDMDDLPAYSDPPPPTTSITSTTESTTRAATRPTPVETTQPVEPEGSGEAVTKMSNTTTFDNSSTILPKVTRAVSSTAAPPINTTSVSSISSGRQIPLVNGMHCKLQKAEDSYRTQPGWIDGLKPYFSGNAIVQVEETIDDWIVAVVFEQVVESIQVWNTVEDGMEENGLLWKFAPHTWNTLLHKGELNVNFIAELRELSEVNPLGRVYLCSSNFTNGDPVVLFGDDDVSEQTVTETTVEEEEEETSRSGATGSTKLPEKKSSTTATPRAQPTATPRARQTATPRARQTASPAGFRPTTTPSNDVRCRSSGSMGRIARKVRQTRPRWKQSRDRTPYDYNELLHKSLLFYEAQRSGALPSRYNRIPWRGDSTLKDGCSVGVDLSAGWFDAGDHVKFTFPMASTVTTLAWGAILYRDAYIDSKTLTRLLGSLKWAVNYLIKAHVSTYELVAQIGNARQDHEYWGRPEEMKMARPVYKITKDAPGSELAAETAAALAAASLVLRRTHRPVALKALDHAKKLYDFATRYKGHYHEAVPEVTDFYRSHNGYDDELIWAGAWLYKATRIKKYLDEAQKNYIRIGGPYQTAQIYSWDNKLIGCQVLLAELTKAKIYTRGIERFMNKMINAVPKTPQGVLWPSEWAPNRYAANAAMIGVMAATLKPPLPKKDDYIKFTREQIHLLVGDAGFSYVVGIGRNYPRRAHHRGSSCPPPPAPCNKAHMLSRKPNPFILYGALVGGPNKRGIFSDRRSNYKETEVALDYNAGYQSAVAGLKHFVMKNRTRITRS